MQQPTAPAIQNEHSSLPLSSSKRPAQRHSSKDQGARVFKRACLGLFSSAFALALGLISLSPAADAMDDRLNAQTSFNIPTQPLGQSLKQFAEQAGIQILFEEQVVSGLRAPALKTHETALQALNSLLKGTGLEFAAKGETIAIRKRFPPTTSNHTGAESAGSAGGTDQHYGSGGAASDSKEPLRVAQAKDQNPASAPSEQTRTQESYKIPENKAALEEILVTAQKKSENLLNVPVPVTVLSAQMLADSNQPRIVDYYTLLPGLSVTPDDLVGTSRVTIRGLSTGGFTNPTVGIVIDDVPYGSSTGLANGYVAPDIDPSELARVEVLRGPQGTLYGASSLGGLIKYVTADPSTEDSSGRIQAGISGIHNGEGLGYNVSASGNVPVSDTFAVRASAFTRRDPGYIDDPALDIRGGNRVQVDGGRISALWRASQDFSLRVSALLQDNKAYGSSLVQPDLGDLQQNLARGSGGLDLNIQAYSANLTARLGSVDLTSLSGYNVTTNHYKFDFSPFYSAFTPMQFGVTGTPADGHRKTSKFTQEIRLSGSIGPRLDWLFGVFYNHEDSPQSYSVLASNFITGAVVGTWAYNDLPSTFSEYAGFTDLSIHVTDRFTVQVGGRASQNRQTYSQSTTGPYDTVFLHQPSPVIQPEVDSKDHSSTYLLTPQLKLSSDLMVYARLASGYRPGGPNTNTALGLPRTYAPDSTRNYEIGFKGNAFDRTLFYDASLYYIDWQNIQLTLVDPNTFAPYNANGSRAKSQGMELSAESKPLTGLKISAWIAFSDATLTDSFPANSSVHGASGDRLPGSSRFSGNLSLEQTFPIANGANGFAAASLSYVSDNLGPFVNASPAPTPRQIYPSYAKMDVRTGIRLDSWSVDIYVNNVADKRAALTGGTGTLFPNEYQYIPPRTLGLSLVKTF